MARDVKEHEEDLDGVAKNVQKLKDEISEGVAAVKRENAKGSHDKATNAVTEFARASPYAASHLGLGIVVLLILVAIALGVAILV